MLVVFLTTMFPIVLVGLFSYRVITRNILILHNNAVTDMNTTWHQTARRYDEQVHLFWDRELALGRQNLNAMAANLDVSMFDIKLNNPDATNEELLRIWMISTRNIRVGEVGNIILINAKHQIIYWQGTILDQPIPLSHWIKDQSLIDTIHQHLNESKDKIINARHDWPDTNDKVQEHLLSYGYFPDQHAYLICVQPVIAYKSMQLLEEIKQQYLTQSLHLDSHDHSRVWIIDSQNNITIPNGISKRMLSGIEHFHPNEQLNGLFNQTRNLQPEKPIQKELILTDPETGVGINHQLTLSYLPHWDWIICVTSHMDCVQQAHRKVLYGVIVIGIIALIVGTCFAYVVALRMAKPIEQLSESARQVTWGSLSVDLSNLTRRKDEYGELAVAFNEMAIGLKSKMRLVQISQEQMKLQNQELKDEIAQRKEAQEQKDKLHDQLLAASREAGMAEIASAVLHNVGNELNSINVSSALVNEQGKQSSLTHLFNIADIMRPHVDHFADFVQNNPQGQLLPRALIELVDTIEPEYNYVMDEIGQLVSGIDRIKQIIQAQQSYVTHVDVNQAVEPAQIFEDALAINHAGIEQRNIVVIKHFNPVPRVHLSKHKVLQILVNLISNAKHALDHTTDQRQITLQMAIHEHQGEHQLIYRVVDTGCGISADQINRIFNHGYTTRPDGRGYGLHYSILTATELGGSLTVKSPGPGQGATFTLILPVNVEAHSQGPRFQAMNI